MPLFEVTSDTGQVLELEGDSPPTEQELEQIFASMGERQVEPEITLGGVLDVAGVGLAGLGEQALEGSLATMGLIAGQDIPEALVSAQSITGAIPDPTLGPEGQATIQAISEKFKTSPQFVQNIVSDFINLGPSLGETVFKGAQELGLSPEVSAGAATAARILPEALEAVTGLRGGRAAIEAAKVIPEVTEQVTEVSKGVAKNAFQFQSRAKQKIAEKIAKGSTDVDTARFQLVEGSVQRDPAGKIIPPPKPKNKIEEFLSVGAPRVKTDPKATEAIKQGFDEGVIAAIKGANPADKKKMLEMTRIMERGKKNQRFALTNRPGKVVGDSLMKRLNIIKGANSRAGKRLDTVAKGLKGQQVDFRQPIDTFVNDLDDMGIDIIQTEGKLSLDFKGSDIEDLAGPEAALNRIFKRMNQKKPIDAFELHRMKRFIDEQVTFGKSAEGLSGKTERILKKLRRNLDGVLDDGFPEYDRVNTAYAETISALDAFQDVAGKKLDLSGDRASEATGQLLRRIMSNAGSRVNLLDSVDQIELIAKRYENFKGELDPRLIEGVTDSKLDDDILTQVLFADELDSVFGPVARTSLQGQVDQSVQRGARAATSRAGAADLVIQTVGKIAEKARGINPEGAFKSIKSVLEEQ